MDMSLFDEAAQDIKSARGVRDHRNKDQDRGSDDFKSLRKANRREKPRARQFDMEDDE
jgi:hypothetical protein